MQDVRSWVEKLPYSPRVYELVVVIGGVEFSIWYRQEYELVIRANHGSGLITEPEKVVGSVDDAWDLAKRYLSDDCHSDEEVTDLAKMILFVAHTG